MVATVLVALPTFTSNMFAVIRKADSMVVGVIPPDITHEDGQKDVGEDYFLVQMTLENSPTQTGQFWDGNKFTERLADE